MTITTEIFAHAQNEIGRLDKKLANFKMVNSSTKENLLKVFLGMDLCYNSATDYYRDGRITEYQWFLYRVAFHWTNFRFYSREQEIYAEKYGFEKLKARINRFRGKLGLKLL